MLDPSEIHAPPEAEMLVYCAGLAQEDGNAWNGLIQCPHFLGSKT